MRVLFRRSLIALVAVLVVASLAVDTETARAANSNINHRSPSPDISDNTSSWHNLILSNNFGKVQDIESGVYFPDENSTTGRNIRFEILNDPSAPSGDKCNIPGASGHDLTETYVVIRVGTGNDASTETVTGNQICNGNLDARVFHIPKSILDANKPGPAASDTGFRDSGLTGVNVSVRWVRSSDAGAPGDVRDRLARANGNDGHSFRFRVIAHNGPNYPGDASGCGGNGGSACPAGAGNATDASVGFIGTNSSSLNNPNNSIVFRGGHKGPNVEYNKFTYTFGLSCTAEDTKFNQEVKLYDVDNGVSSQPRPANFYVGRIDSEGKVTPLRTGEYSGRGEGGATRLNDIDISEHSTHSFNRDNLEGTDLIEVARSNNNTPHNASDDFDHPIFYPSNFHNFGGETKVKVHRVEPETRYVVVVDMVHKGQYIYSGLPGDAIFGSPTYDHVRECPEGTSDPRLQPFVSLSKSQYEVGEAPTAHAWIDKQGNNVEVDTTRQFWYETSSDWDQDTRREGGETMIHEVNPNHWNVTSSTFNLPNWTAGEFPNPGPGGRIPNPAVPANAKFVCTLLELRNPSVPGTTIETPNPAVSCSSLVRRPRVEVLRGDINTTKQDVTQFPCVDASSNHIASYWEDGHGSGTELAAFAGGNVRDFVSAALRASLPTVPKGLTFANTTGSYGERFGKAVGCNVDADWSIARAISTSTNRTLTNYSPGAGTIYHKGTLRINGNVEYPAVPFDLTNMPYLKVVVDGDIYIQSNVQRVDGIYMATGTIYTCTQGNNKPTDINDAALKATCDNNRLTVNGTLIANSIKFLRLTGSLRTDAAETVTYDPLIWLRAIQPDDDGLSLPPFDSYTTMPPVL